MLAKMLLLSACLTGTAIADVVVLRPSADSSMYNDSAAQTSNSLGQYIFAGNSGSGGTRRALVKFDIAAALPADAQISSAELVLTISRQGPNVSTASISRCLTQWGEGTSQATGEEGAGVPAELGDPSWTFASYDTRAWNLPGGDFTNVPSDTTDARELNSISFGGPALAANVLAWFQSPPVNFGWIIQGDESEFGTAIRFNSRENTDVNSRPALYITYTRGCAADFNHDQAVDFFDYLDFVAAFAGNAPEADFNGDSAIDFFDYLDFVAAFASGC